MRNRNLWLSLAAMLFVAGVFGKTASAQNESPKPFENGDRICFVGDSITHGGQYHNQIAIFYATRYPDRTIAMFNCGISGDSATGALKRLDWDILANTPSVATVMLGMNDVGRNDYGKENPDKNLLARREANLKRHEENMRGLVKGLRDAGAQVILITPSIYDQTAQGQTPNLFGVNDALGLCAEKAKALAAEMHCTVVDFHAPMTMLNAKIQEASPTATIVGKDRVHPGIEGHLLMAYLFLKAQGVSGVVSKVGLDAASGSVTASENCAVENVAASAEKVAFSCTANALPFPLPDKCDLTLSLVPLVNELNQETLTVTNLSAGDYTLMIDKKKVGTYSAEQLAAGVNLAENKETPQYKQARDVASLCGQRHNLVANKLRRFIQIETSLRGRPDLDINDLAAVSKVLDEKTEELKKKNQLTPYYEQIYQQYKTEKPKQAEFEAEVRTINEKLRTANKPVKREYVLSR